MTAHLALLSYYLAAFAAMATALYLWRDLSLSHVSTKLTALTKSSAALTKTLEDERNSAREQQQAADVERTAERVQWTSQFQHVREHMERLRHELAEARNHSLTRWQAFAEMEEIWGGDSEEPANEADAKKLLRENMWVLEPEYRLVNERIDWEVKLANALTTLYGTFGVVESRTWREQPNLDQLVDIAALVSMDGALGTQRTHAGSEALLLIEAKRPGSGGVLNEAARDQVLRYAADLRKLAPDKLMGHRIECLLIGGRIPDRMNDIVVKWDSEGEAPTMVRFLTWETLLTRAERACELSGPRPNALQRRHDSLRAQAAQ